MGLATLVDFKARYPELSPGNTNDAVIQDFLDEALLFMNLAVCPKISHLVQMAYAAHGIAKSSFNPEGMDTSSGSISSESVGSVSVSYQLPEVKGNSTSWYMSTEYGKQFLRYRKVCFGTSVVTAP